MFESLHWDRGLNSIEARQQLDELRADSLRLFLIVATVGYLVWHFLNSVLGVTERQVSTPFFVAALAVPTLVASWLLVSHSRRLAVFVFLVGGVASTAWALYVTGDSHLAMILAMFALVAGFISSPVVGLILGVCGVAMLELVSLIRPDTISSADILGVAVFTLLAIIGVWVLTYHIVLTLNWYTESYTRAARHTREAQEHRAQLVQAWRQLDEAYHRLESANSALQLAWKAADAAERSKLEFAANLSHEFRTPLNLIVGYSEMVITSPESYGGVPLPSEYRGDLSAIYRAAQHILSLTDDVLDLARLEVGHLGISREPTDLLQTIQEAASLVRDYVEAKKLELRLSLPSEMPLLLVDRLRIRQVLLNLLANASRFTERGHIEVRVEVKPDVVRVIVADTGSGIPAEELPHIFERFASKGGHQSVATTGAGLGLPISKHIVELHGGEMSAESTPGGGATFWFTLPLISVDGIAVEPAHVSVGRGYLRASQQVVVLVHPDPDVGRLFQRHLEGFRVEVVGQMSEARTRAQELTATAIISAVDDPGDGDSGPIPLVRCWLPERAGLAKHLGIDAYLVKPVTREALLQAVGQYGGRVKRVLIADDDVRFTRLLGRMLMTSDSRYEVRTAHNGEEAVAHLRSDKPDLLLLDLAMPELDGFGVLEVIAKDPSLRGVRVIVVSAASVGEGAFGLGSEVVIRKPGGFELGELIELVGAAISKLSVARSSLPDRAEARGSDPLG